jgi:GR25 family glycosyltransferase involved in LPS biosynthesis
MSHLGVLRKATQMGCSRVLIFEDDLSFAADFNARLEQSVKTLTAELWDVFYGGYRLAPWRDLSLGAPAIAPDQELRCSHFVALQSPAMRLAVPFLEAMLMRPGGHVDGGPMHVDGAYNWLRRRNPKLITRLAVPQLGYQRSSRTDVHSLRWFDRLPVLRQATAAVRRVRNLVLP